MPTYERKFVRRGRSASSGQSADAHPIDGLVGARLRLRRMELRLSQTDVGEALGVAFQQVQKYERGANRVSASRLYQLAEILDVPMNYFFPPSDKAAHDLNRLTRILADRDILRLAAALDRITDRQVRATIIAQTEAACSALTSLADAGTPSDLDQSRPANGASTPHHASSAQSTQRGGGRL